MLTTKDPSDFLEEEETLEAWLKGGFQSVNDEWLGSLAVFGRLGPSLEYLEHFSYRNSSDIKLGKGFRASMLPEMFAEGLHFRGFPPFVPDNFFVPNLSLRPEMTRSWEGGLHTHWDGLSSR